MLTSASLTIRLHPQDDVVIARQQLVTVNYAAAPAWTPQTYTVNWGAAAKVSDVVQVIDGQWAIDNGTARPTIMEFDRLLGIGDLSWRDYTVTVPITILAMDPAGSPVPATAPASALWCAGKATTGPTATPSHAPAGDDSARWAGIAGRTTLFHLRVCNSWATAACCWARARAR